MRMAIGMGLDPGLKRGFLITSISILVPITVSARAS